MATLVYPGQTTEINMGLGKSETRLGDDVVTGGFAGELEHYQDKADPADQQKCAELLASLRYGQDQQRFAAAVRRPKTAMAALGIADITHVTRPYETTHQREYVPRPDPNVRAIRPMTSHGFAEPDTVPPAAQVTHYDDEFRHKHQRPASPYRSGTASGSRANKPHPPKSFMVWKFPSKTQAFPQSSPWSEELTNEKLNQVTKRLCRSTYQSDYLGIPQGFQVKSAYGHLPPDWKERVPYTLHSFQRATYRTPQQQPEHLVPTNRYGSNARKHLASSGVIPTANLRATSIKSRTTYDRHYNDLAPDVALQARDPSRLLVADAIRLQHEKAFAHEKVADTSAAATADHCQGYETMARGPPTPQPPSHPRPPSGTRSAHAQPCYRARPRVPEATCVTNYGYSGNGNAYDTFQHQLDHPSPNLSHISVPYSPPQFLA